MIPSHLARSKHKYSLACQTYFWPFRCFFDLFQTPRLSSSMISAISLTWLFNQVRRSILFQLGGMNREQFRWKFDECWAAEFSSKQQKNNSELMSELVWGKNWMIKSDLGNLRRTLFWKRRFKFRSQESNKNKNNNGALKCLR